MSPNQRRGPFLDVIRGRREARAAGWPWRFSSCPGEARLAAQVGPWGALSRRRLGSVRALIRLPYRFVADSEGDAGEHQAQRLLQRLQERARTRQMQLQKPPPRSPGGQAVPAAASKPRARKRRLSEGGPGSGARGCQALGMLRSSSRRRRNWRVWVKLAGGAVSRGRVQHQRMKGKPVPHLKGLKQVRGRAPSPEASLTVLSARALQLYASFHHFCSPFLESRGESNHSSVVCKYRSLFQ